MSQLMRPPPPVMPALVTPFTEAGEVDLDAHRHNVGLLWDRGVRGFLIGGSTGEGPYLEPGEREALVGEARRHLPADAFLLGGVAAETLRLARRQLAEVAAAGADAALVLTPTTLTRGQEPSVVEGFYRELAGESPIPLLLYSVPSYTAYELPLEVAARLLDHPGVAGMKDSGGQPVRLARLAARASGEVFLFAGASAALAWSVAGGGYGAITASANYAPELVAEVVEAARRSPQEAREAQERLARLSGEVEAHRIPGVKQAARSVGLRPGSPRRPLRPLEGAQAAEVEEAMAAYLTR